MRKIIVTSNITLDGVMQSPAGADEDVSGGFKYGGWAAPYADQVSGRAVQKDMKDNTDYLLGSKTYDIFSSFWPAHAEKWPSINDGTKYVLSSTRQKSDWGNTVFLRNLEDIKNLKTSEGKNLQVWGSSELVSLLLDNALVDELHLRIFPLILGRGKKIFSSGSIATALALTENIVTEKGVIIARYQRMGEVKTGTL